ncbi:MAG: replicative DNA helicase [Bacilli bacterium]|nr:replicative DNA helicase [Bacilli bacterium]
MLDVLPHNIPAEKSVLGAMISSRDALIEASSGLVVEDFFDLKNQIVFGAILRVQDKREPVDVQTVTNELINSKEFEKIGGIEYLLEITESNIAPSNYKHYIDIVKDQAVLRNYLLQLKETINQYDKEEINDVSTFIGLTAERILRKAESRKISSFETAESVANRVKADLNTIKITDEDGVTGLTTGYKRLNELTHGWQKSDMIILAARPSVGKTAFALNLCLNATLKTKKSVGIFSLEMPAEMLMMRLVANRSTVELGKIQTGKISQRDYVAIDKALSEIASTKLYIDDSPNIKLMDILSKARKLKMEHPDLALIMIDYIGLITTGNKKVESRQVEVSEISRQLKALARELEIPILVLCQLSRNVEQAKTGGRKPVISDLRESGSIEQDADVIMLLSRPDYQNKDTSNMKALTKDTNEPIINENGETISQVTVTVGKNRNGPIGDVKLIFTKTIGRFDEQANNDDYGD